MYCFTGCRCGGLCFLDEIEKVQLKFFKRLLSLPINTPNYAVMLETGSLRLSRGVLSNALNWIYKISKMNSSRYPRQCFEGLTILAIRNPNCRRNWLIQFAKSFDICDLTADWWTSPLNSAVSNRNLILERYDRKLRALDLVQYSRSGSLLLYPFLSVNRGPQYYLKSLIALQTKRVFAQIRLLNKHVCRVNLGNFSYKFNAEEYCPSCRREAESFAHILLNCPAYEHLCAAAFPDICSAPDAFDFWCAILSSSEIKNIKSFVKLVSGLLRELHTSKTSLILITVNVL